MMFLAKRFDLWLKRIIRNDSFKLTDIC